MKYRGVNIAKTVYMTIGLHVIEIIVLIILATMGIIGALDRTFNSVEWLVLLGLLAVTLVNSWMSIRYALALRHEILRSDTLEDAMREVNQLNNTMRAQRHDFMNHLQIVHGLIEIEEYDEARAYIHRVYGDIRSISRVLRTSILPVNALLQAKAQQAQQRGIAITMNILSTLEHFPLPQWEICRVLANLLDNSIEVLEGRADGQIELMINEDLSQWIIMVRNNGPEIPKEIREKIMNAGFTTRIGGHGMGLYIVNGLITNYQGSMSVDSNGKRTSFLIHIPRPAEVQLDTADDISNEPSPDSIVID